MHTTAAAVFRVPMSETVINVAETVCAGICIALCLNVPQYIARSLVKMLKHLS